MTVQKIDKRRKYIAVFDTETAGTLGAPLVYDLVVTICDKQGRIYEQGKWVISEVFDNKKLMDNAYFGKKRPWYVEQITKGLMPKVPFKVARAQFNRLMEKWNVQMVAAYNLSFDMRALTATTRYLHKQFLPNESKKFLARNLEIQDIWGFACETIYQQKMFHRMIDQRGYFTPKENPLTNAEIGYRYITNQHDFEERHTALNDTEVEVAILAKCFASHKKYTKGIVGNPWRIVANRHKELAVA